MGNAARRAEARARLDAGARAATPEARLLATARLFEWGCAHAEELLAMGPRLRAVVRERAAALEADVLAMGPRLALHPHARCALDWLREARRSFA